MFAVVTHLTDGAGNGSHDTTDGRIISRYLAFGVVQLSENSLLQPARGRPIARRTIVRFKIFNMYRPTPPTPERIGRALFVLAG